MNSLLRSTITAITIAAAIQFFTVGLLSPWLPREVCRPGITAQRTLTVEAAPMLTLHNADGAVEVQTHDAAEVTIQADIRAYYSSSEAKTLAEEYVKTLLNVNVNDFAVEVVSEPDKRPNDIDLQMDYVVTVPKGTNVTIEGTNGNIWIAKGCGRIEVRGSNADIDILEPGGPVEAASTNGRIRVYNANNNTNLETVNGSIYAHMDGGSLKANTTNGAIVTRILDPRVKACNLTSLNGGITLVMKDSCSGVVLAKSGKGIIKSDLPINNRGPMETRRELFGTIGKGKTMLSMESLNGNIWITRSTS